MGKKQCNYCGSKNLDVLKDYDPAIMLSPKRYVHCNQCGADGPLADDDNEAIQKWNSRIQEAPEMTQERPNIIIERNSDDYYCPFSENQCDPDKNCCMGFTCMMWIWVGNDKGRCGLVNKIYEATGCRAV